MRRLIWAGAGLALLTMGTLSPVRAVQEDAAAKAGEGIPWAKSLETALSAAKSGNKLVMVDFYTDWCTWCKKLDKDTYTDKKVIEATDQLVAVKVNAEKEGVDAAKKYKVNGFPTILFIDGSGEMVGKIVGYLPPEGFTTQVNKIIQTGKDLPALKDKYASDPNDLETAAKLGAIYAGQGKETEAAELLTKVQSLDPDNAKGQLVPTATAVGDMYQESGQFDKAIPAFKTAAAKAKEGKDVAYAHMSIAVCYLMQRKLDEALPEVKATLAVADAPKEMKEQANQMLAFIKKQKEAKPKAATKKTGKQTKKA